MVFNDFSYGRMGKNDIIFVVGMSSSVHINNKQKDILVLGLRSTKGIDDTSLTAGAPYSISFSRLNIIFFKPVL